MSKPWKPGRETVALPSEPRPSRIRRAPVHVDTVVKARPSRERELWAGVVGVVVIAACSAALVVGLSQVTSFTGPAEVPAGPQFVHCQAQGDLNCVLDGDTFFLAGQRVEIAGIDAPEVRGARCREEARRGIQAAVRLHELLNRGQVTTTAAAGPGGQPLSKVDADGVDVAAAMIGYGLARDYGDGPRSWC